jgi:hypothetical protein
LTVVPVLIVAAVVCASCASGRRGERTLASANCGIVVHNQTPHALEIRMAVRPLTTVPIGALNPAELLNYPVSCARGTVWVTGVAIAQQVGVRTTFGAVGGSATLVPGERVHVDLHWP